MELKTLQGNNPMKNHKPRRIAMYVIYDPDGKLDGFRKYYLQELRKVVDTIVAVVSGTLTPESRKELEGLADQILVRENKGLLAGSWIDGIHFIGWDVLDTYDELLMLNDSFFGPFYPLDDMFEKMEESDSDFYGAFQNFEDKNIRELGNGHYLKHGYVRGSICYFYIIKERLLHSPEFKRYWSKTPTINDGWDAVMFNEMNFWDYVKDAGFKIDAYQDESLRGYCFDNLSQNMYRLIRYNKIPFARIRSFATDIRDVSNYGKDPRQTLELIDRNTNYDVNLIWDYLLRTKNLTHIWNQLQLEYVIPNNVLEKEYTYTKPIAVILHIFYDDQVERIAKYCENFPDNTDFYITTVKSEVKRKIEAIFSQSHLNFKCQIRPNIGAAMPTLWVTYSDIVTNGNYQYICYFHDKKSPYGTYRVQGDQFATRCYDNLFGTKEIVKNIINLFERNPRLGIVGPPVVYNGDYFFSAQKSWAVNYSNVIKLAKLLDIQVNIDSAIMPVAPYGDMMWFRAAALKKAIGKNLGYKFFDTKYEKDGTMMHAIERIYGFAAQDSGYYYADVINTDDARSDLINYQYMLYGLCNEMMKNGHYPYNYETAKWIIAQYRGQPLSFESFCKMKIKGKIPSPIWYIGKKIGSSRFFVG